MLHTARLQSAMSAHATSLCINKCLDTSELYTLKRTKYAPISYRLKQDVQEKECVVNCSAKFNAMLQLVLMQRNEAAVGEMEASVMEKMMEQMRAGMQ
ncbi:hypothetical protein AGDE_03041 [Angomonas deanei]|nr:hypothetical protein AGDE_03041 [Angomonas deanei]|eukprot:EPY40885.1 hypothetical protein AGDE_03041 [Angomonas deanei]